MRHGLARRDDVSGGVSGRPRVITQPYTVVPDVGGMVRAAVPLDADEAEPPPLVFETDLGGLDYEDTTDVREVVREPARSENRASATTRVSRWPGRWVFAALAVCVVVAGVVVVLG